MRHRRTKIRPVPDPATLPPGMRTAPEVRDVFGFYTPRLSLYLPASRVRGEA